MNPGGTDPWYKLTPNRETSPPFHWKLSGPFHLDDDHVVALTQLPKVQGEAPRVAIPLSQLAPHHPPLTLLSASGKKGPQSVHDPARIPPKCERKLNVCPGRGAVGLPVHTQRPSLPENG